MSYRAELVGIVNELRGRLPHVPGLAGRLASLDDGDLLVWNGAAGIERTVTTSLPSSAELLAATPDLTSLAASFDEELWIVSGDVTAPAVRIAIPVDGAVFLPSGRLIVTAPSAQREGKSFSESHRVLLLEPTGAVIDEAVVEADDAAPYLLRHPVDAAVVCDFLMGQDGNVLTVVRDVDGRLEVEEIFRAEDYVTLSFSPLGDRVLFSPYPSDPERAVVATWPGLAIDASLDAAAIDLEMGFDVSGGHLSDDRILLLATEQGPVLADRDLTNPGLIEMVDLEDYVGDGFVETVAPFGADAFVAVLWDAGKRTTTVWRLI
ncbi:hypothetical protein ASE14_01115 [Agromyces sp. Root81]|uniref:hypothetical protein n=1 Tax=Agromyces sp. Root81 TaxID=1736601 RepID=UPI0007009193|nr:hypothetical protein [Agromyces sp. Root81]KRC62469.1 hypothetical protein ASE14_01115 [Agromyces sp. Root81]